jgi:hypothetical protein
LKNFANNKQPQFSTAKTMLPTTRDNVPRPGSRFRSARNQSVMQSISSKLSWSSRNSSSYNAYKKNDNHNNNNGNNMNGGGMIAIDTSYLSNNIPFTDNFPTGSKSKWHKITKQANRKLLDKPWLLPTIVGTSFLSAIFIIFFTIFSNSSNHAEISSSNLNPTLSTTTSNSASNMNMDDRNQYTQDYHSQTGLHKRSQERTHQQSQRSYYAKQSSNSRNAPVPERTQPPPQQQRQPVHTQSSSNTFSLEKSVDYVFNLFHNNDPNRWNAVSSLSQKYCIDLPHFTLENQDSIDNLKGNIGTLIFDLVKFNPIYSDATPSNVVISNKGTFIPTNNIGNKYSHNTDTTHCDLVTHLYQIADDLGMLHKTTQNLHNFDIEPENFWESHKTDVSHKNINDDVSKLFEYANNNEFYEISMELPKLVGKHCTHTETWIRNMGTNAEENFYNSLSRAIFTVNNAQTSDVSDNVIGFPVIDSNGDLMQLESGILSFDKNDINGHKNLHYSRCELLDKIVFHGLTMTMNKHIDFMYDAASKDDFYGFEILADLLDTEYCSIINSKLSETARNNLGLHLWSMTKDILNGKFYLTSDINDDSNEYVITTEGGIMHSQIAINDLKLKKSQIIHCSMVKEIIKRGIKYHSGNTNYYGNNNNFDDTQKNEFEHRYDDSGLASQFMDEMTGVHDDISLQQLKMDAKLVIQHLQNGQETEFVKLLDYLLDQYHFKWFNSITNKRSIKLMIEQTLHSIILGNVNLSSQYNPSNDLSIIRKDVNELEIIDKNDFKGLTNDVQNSLERLPLLDEIFKQIVEMNAGH